MDKDVTRSFRLLSKLLAELWNVRENYQLKVIISLTFDSREHETLKPWYSSR